MQILFVGDVMLGRLVNDVLHSMPPEAIWGDTLPLFQAADLRFCNLECVLADNGSPWRPETKVFHFRSDSRHIASLKVVGMDCVSNANNHALDYGDEALLEMLNLLDREHIYHAGAGINIQTASAMTVINYQTLRIGFIAFTDNEPDWEAQANTIGVFYCPIDSKSNRAQYLFRLIEESRSQVDYLIVSAHWGGNWGYRPRSQHIAFAHSLIEKGADIIFGHSCHVFQGIEIYQGKVILYSCGDFLDDYRVDKLERNDQSFVFMLKISPVGIHRLRLFPTFIKHLQVQRAKGDLAQSIARKMQVLSEEYRTKSYWNEESSFLEIPIVL